MGFWLRCGVVFREFNSNLSFEGLFDLLTKEYSSPIIVKHSPRELKTERIFKEVTAMLTKEQILKHKDLFLDKEVTKNTKH